MDLHSWDSQDREIDYVTCESMAYSRLAACGLCERGLVAQFYGAIVDIDPTKALPFLADFLEDQNLPSGLLLEYIPDMKVLDPSTFTPAIKDTLLETLLQLHKIGFWHGDIELRHMVIQPSTGRAMWIDFDRSQTFPPNEMTVRWQDDFEFEEELVREMLDDVVSRLHP